MKLPIMTNNPSLLRFWGNIFAFFFFCFYFQCIASIMYFCPKRCFVDHNTTAHSCFGTIRLLIVLHAQSTHQTCRVCMLFVAVFFRVANCFNAVIVPRPQLVGTSAGGGGLLLSWRRAMEMMSQLLQREGGQNN